MLRVSIAESIPSLISAGAVAADDVLVDDAPTVPRILIVDMAQNLDFSENLTIPYNNISMYNDDYYYNSLNVIVMGLDDGAAGQYRTGSGLLRRIGSDE